LAALSGHFPPSYSDDVVPAHLDNSPPNGQDDRFSFIFNFNFCPLIFKESTTFYPSSLLNLRAEKMGSHYFDHCLPEQRFTMSGCIPYLSGVLWYVEDWDQRRRILVYSPVEKYDDDFIFSALAKFVDDLPADALRVSISDDGTFLSSKSDITEDFAFVPFYPSLADFPTGTATVSRGDLTEVDRLGLMVDLTTYQPRPGVTKKVVFKYFVNVANRASIWHETNCVMRIPKHPNIVPFDALVVDVVEGDDKVVGFVTQYVPGGTLDENDDRVFKLKYLKQLIQVCISCPSRILNQ